MRKTRFMSDMWNGCNLELCYPTHFSFRAVTEKPFIYGLGLETASIVAVHTQNTRYVPGTILNIHYII